MARRSLESGGAGRRVSRKHPHVDGDDLVAAKREGELIGLLLDPEATAATEIALIGDECHGIVAAGEHLVLPLDVLPGLKPTTPEGPDAVMTFVGPRDAH